MPAAAGVTLHALNAMDGRQFAAALGGAFEHSPWVAERAWAARPFESLDALHTAMAAVVHDAGPERQLALLRAHPDLAGRAARAGAVAADSAAEQASAELDRLTDAEYERFARLNAHYRERFGFPFIIAVRRHDKAGILAAFETRLRNDAGQERETALAEVLAIARLRLDGLVGR
jgi:2-oxo-4-hydroxy-4-carboxy-5-ureidoimidazoline decarboxylase